VASRFGRITRRYSRLSTWPQLGQVSLCFIHCFRQSSWNIWLQMVIFLSGTPITNSSRQIVQLTVQECATF
jgi:hypothetical protein